MEKGLVEDIHLLKKVIQELPGPVGFYAGKELRLTVANQAMLEIAGHSDVIGKTFEEVFSESDLQKYIDKLIHVFETGVMFHSADWITVPVKEELHYFEFTFKQIRSSKDEVLGVLHTASDITHLVNSDATDSVRQGLTGGEKQKLLSLVENSVDFMGISDMNLKMVYLNKNGRKLIGIDEAADISHIHVKDFYSPKFFKTVGEKIDPALKKHGKWSGTLYLRNFKTGEDIPFKADFILMYDPETGDPVARGATLRDLRAEMAASEALSLSEKRFRRLVQQAPVAIAIVRGEQLIVEVANDEALRLWGRSKAIIGLPILEALPELKKQEFPDLLLKVLKTGQPEYGMEMPAYLVLNGREEIHYFNFVYSPIRELNDELSGVMIVGNEVTSQVKYRKELEESERRFRSIVLEAPVAKALYVGREMVIELANESMIKMWGKDDSVIGKKLRDALPELEGQPFLDILDKVYTTGVPYHTERQSAELEVDGQLQTFWFNFTYKPLHNAQGEVYAVLNAAVDISSQVYLQKQKDDFLGVASHELKTPVTSIKAYAQVLESLLRKSGDKEKAYMVSKLDNQVNRLTNLISDLLDVTKINSGRIKFHRTHFDFNDMVKEMVEEVQRTAQHHDIQEELQPVGSIYGDRERLGQVIINFITNAIKYSPEANRVLVSTFMEGDHVVLCVEDFGIGISKDKQTKVFEQFYRVSSDKQHTFPGLGLGLYISSEIIRREGGTIWVESVVGKGSKFYFSLPLSKQNIT